MIHPFSMKAAVFGWRSLTNYSRDASGLDRVKWAPISPEQPSRPGWNSKDQETPWRQGQPDALVPRGWSHPGNHSGSACICTSRICEDPQMCQGTSAWAPLLEPFNLETGLALQSSLPLVGKIHVPWLLLAWTFPPRPVHMPKASGAAHAYATFLTLRNMGIVSSFQICSCLLMVYFPKVRPDVSLCILILF